jgi:hypothetical protein
MHQLVEQLNFALNAFDTSGSSASPSIVYTSKNALLKENEKPAVDSTATFNAIKGLIIKSADIVEAYSQEIERKLNGIYVAQSDFGTYMEETELTIEGTPTNITQFYRNFQTVEVLVNNTLGYIKTGELYRDENGHPVYGIEIGEEKINEDNETTFDMFARFTADRLEFYDPQSRDGEPTAYISGSKLVIIEAEIKTSLKIGGYLVDTTNGLTFKWVGRW